MAPTLLWLLPLLAWALVVAGGVLSILVVERREARRPQTWAPLETDDRAAASPLTTYALTLEVLALVFLILALAGAARAAEPAHWADGVRIGNGDDVLTVSTGRGITVVLTFDAEKAPVLNGTTLDLQDDTTALAWRLVDWAPTRIRLEGTPGAATTFRVAGLAGEWRILGAAGEPIVGSAGGPFTVPVSASAIDLTRVGGSSTTSSSSSSDSGSSSTSSGDRTSRSNDGGEGGGVVGFFGSKNPLEAIGAGPLIGAGLLVGLLFSATRGSDRPRSRRRARRR